MSEVRIRAASPKDADAVAEVFIASFGTLTFLPKLHTDEETADFITNTVMAEQEVSVAEVGDAIVGFVATSHGDHLEHLYVHPDHQGRGIGTALLERAKARMPGGFRLWVFQANAARGASTNGTGCGSCGSPTGRRTRRRRRTRSTSGSPADVVRRIGVAERRARLGRRHHLAAPTTTAEGLAGDLAGLHSSDPPTPYLASWARVKDFAPAELEDALYERRSVLRMIGMRRTLFVVPLDLAAAIDAACTKALVPRERKRLARWLEEYGHVRPGGGERWIDRVSAKTLDVLRERGEAAGRELTKEVPELGVRFTYGEGTTWAGSMGGSTRILFLLSIEGKVSRARPVGTFASGQYRWAPMDAWLERPCPSSTTRQRAPSCYGGGSGRSARARCATSGGGPGGRRAHVEHARGRRRGDGPHRRRHRLRAARRPRSGRRTRAVGGAPARPRPDRDGLEGARLVPAEQHVPLLFDRNGNAGPTVWSNGRIVGGWWQDDDGVVVLRLLSRVDAATRRAIERERDRLQDWLGDVRLRLRFPTPLERSSALPRSGEAAGR